MSSLHAVLSDWWTRYRRWRQAHAVTAPQVLWYLGGAWSLILVGVLDLMLPPAAARDLLYLVPLGVATWQLGPQAAWLLAINAGTIRVIAAGHRLGSGADTAVEWSLAASAVEFGLFTYGLLRLRGALARERRRATEDALTGVLNRGAFVDALTRVMDGTTAGNGWRGRWRRRRRPAGTGALAYVDLDGFKAVNDSEGHDVGDAVLQVAAAVLRGSVRSGDTVARLGGDEFALWLPGATAEEAHAIATRALETLRARTAAQGWAVGASIGVAVFPVRPPDAAAALRTADALMYAVKRSGKGRVHVALQSAA